MRFCETKPTRKTARLKRSMPRRCVMENPSNGCENEVRCSSGQWVSTSRPSCHLGYSVGYRLAEKWSFSRCWELTGPDGCSRCAGWHGRAGLDAKDNDELSATGNV